MGALGSNEINKRTAKTVQFHKILGPLSYQNLFALKNCWKSGGTTHCWKSGGTTHSQNLLLFFWQKQ
jgi:hypothetical protein